MRDIEKNQSVVVLGFILLWAFVWPSLLLAEVPQRINYQGYLTDALGTPIDGDYQIVFSIYDVPTAGTALWSEEQTVSVFNGIYNVQIGQDPVGNPFPGNLFDGQRWLGVTVEADTEMTPRQILTSTPFAMRAEVADAVVDGVINTVHIVDNAVTGAKISNGTVQAVDLKDGTALTEIADDDGAGSGLDADRLDGLNSSDLALAGHNHWGETWSGSGRGLVLNSSNNTGLQVSSGGADGIQVTSAHADGVVITSAGDDGMVVGSSVGDGMLVQSAGSNGMRVQSAGNDGVHVDSAGSPSTTSSSVFDSGFEVEGAEGNGLYVGRADRSGVLVESAITGLAVESADNYGVILNNVGGSGFVVGNAGYDGVKVGIAGHPTTFNQSAEKNGFEVAGAEGNGLYVGQADLDGVHVASTGRYGVQVGSAAYDGMFVFSADYNGVYVHRAGVSTTTNISLEKNGFAVDGAEGHGLFVGRADLSGVRVDSAGYNGLYVKSAGYAGVQVVSSNQYGVYVGSAGTYAGYFNGDVHITGTLSKGGGTFKIDHPLDPENKYLNHSFVESPDMKNIYDGTVMLNDKGEAWIELPEWFEALNKDFRYQLTPIGASMPKLYISQEVENNRFQIAGGKPGMKVSWQVTGIRQDPFAEANRIQVEEEKPPEEQGTYLHPEAYGMPDTMGVAYRESQGY